MRYTEPDIYIYVFHENKYRLVPFHHFVMLIAKDKEGRYFEFHPKLLKKIIFEEIKKVVNKKNIKK